MENSSFFLLSWANSFYSNILAQLATSCSSFAEPSNIPNIFTAKFFTTYFITLIVSSLAPNPKPIATPLTFIAAPLTSTQVFSSNIKAYEDGYKYESDIELFIILPKSIMIMHGKTFIKTKDLAYFSKIKKHSKIWDHDTQLLKV